MNKNSRKLAVLLASLGFAASGVAVAQPASAGPPINPDYAQNQQALLSLCNVEWMSCTFQVQSDSAPWIDFHRVGTPVTNCAPGATENISRWVGEVYTESQTWTVGAGVELGIADVLGIAVEGSYAETTAISVEERGNVEARPGRKNSVTLGVQYIQQTGRVYVGYDTNGSPLYVNDVKRTVPTE